MILICNNFFTVYIYKPYLFPIPFFTIYINFFFKNPLHYPIRSAILTIVKYSMSYRESEVILTENTSSGKLKCTLKTKQTG